MKKKINLMYILLMMMLCFISLYASADNIVISTSDLMPFLYGDSSYIPLKITTNFLGMPLQWDAAKGNAIITYQGKDFILTPNSLNAMLEDQPVALASPPVIINGVTYIPTQALRKYYNVPVEWDRVKSEVKIKGPKGWGTMKTKSRAPWHGGPPPWAPAWGQRGYGTLGHTDKVKMNGNGKAKAWGQHKYDDKGRQNKEKSNGNGKSKGNKKDN